MPLQQEHLEGAAVGSTPFILIALPKIWSVIKGIWDRIRKGSTTELRIRNLERALDEHKKSDDEKHGELLSHIDAGFNRVHQRIDEMLLARHGTSIEAKEG